MNYENGSPMCFKTVNVLRLETSEEDSSDQILYEFTILENRFDSGGIVTVQDLGREYPGYPHRDNTLTIKRLIPQK